MTRTAAQVAQHRKPARPRPWHRQHCHTAARQPIILWAYVVAAHEGDYPRNAHRDPSVYRAGYLRHLVDLGYTPAETDRLVLGEQTFTADAADVV